MRGVLIVEWSREIGRVRRKVSNSEWTPTGTDEKKSGQPLDCSTSRLSIYLTPVYEFRWNEWNVDHIADHGVRPREAEEALDAARPPWPEKIGDGKWRVWGCSRDGTYLQVIFVLSPGDIVFVIHAMPLTERQKKQYRRRAR